MNVMKKLLPVLLCIMMVVAVFSVTTYAADGKTNIGMEISTTTVNVGDTFTITVFYDDMNVASFGCTLQFDKNLVEFVSVVGCDDEYPEDIGLCKGRKFDDATVSGVEETNANGQIGLIVVNTDDKDYDACDIYTATFRAKASGTVTFTLIEDSGNVVEGVGDGFGGVAATQTVTIAADHTCTLTHVEAKSASCVETGNIEYWYCEDCNQYWLDEALTELTNADGVTTPINKDNHVQKPAYTNNGDTHSVDYPCCDGLDVVSENHSYENGQCICGAKEPFTVGVVNSYGVADAITLSNPIAIPGQDYVTTISGTVGTSFGIWGVYNAAGEWIDPYFCCIFDGETNTLTVRGEYVDEGMVLEIGAWVTATYYLNGGYVNSRFDTSFVPDANGAFTWEWNCGDYPFSFWDFDIGGNIRDGNYAFEREGYTLVGYNTAADGSGTMYGFEQKVAHTEDIVLYMIWECNHDTWQDATCTAPKTCTTCGKTEGEALGHSEPVYTNNGDTHSAVYPCCGEAYVTNEPHDFENEDHKCVCGKVEQFTITWTVNGEKVDETKVAFGAAITKPDVNVPSKYYSYVWTTEIPNTASGDLTIEGYWTAKLVVLDENGKEMQFSSGGLSYYPQWKIAKVGETAYANYRGTNYKEGHTLYLVNVNDSTEKYEITYESGMTVYPSVPMTENKTLQLTAVPETYTVTWTVNGEKVDETKVTFGAAITAPDYTVPEGHSFSGWTVPGTMPDTDITLDATLTVNTYTVTFTVNGEYYADAQVKYGQSVTVPEFEIPEGHSFSGWTGYDTMPAEDITLDATLTANTYTVTFTVNGEYYADAQVKYGQIVTAPEYVIPEGHSFSGWTVPDTMPAEDITLDAALTVNFYVLSIYFGDFVNQYGLNYNEIRLQVPYGALLKDYLVETPDIIANTDALQGKYTFAYWHTYASDDALDTETATMPANYIRYYATYDYTGWYIEEGGKYFVDHYEPVEGWFCVNDKNELVTDGSGDWYYIDPYKDYINTGVSRAPYPTDKINGITYGPDADALALADKYNYPDDTEAWFLFDEDGKFLQTTGMGTYNGATRYMDNGMLKWHPGLIKIGEDYYYYFIGDIVNGGNIAADGEIYISYNNGYDQFKVGGIYTFENGKLVGKNGIVEEGGKLYYYVNNEKQVGLGLVEYDGGYIFVRSNGELAIGVYYVGDAKYDFDETTGIAYGLKNGVIGNVYYENGHVAYAAGLIEWNGNVYYVRSNGEVATGEYYVTNVANYTGELNIQKGMKLFFGEDGKLQTIKNGIVEEADGLYYYKDNCVQYGAGLVEIEEGVYIYVKSNGQLATGKYYITKTNDLEGFAVGQKLFFGEDGILQISES